MSFTPQEIKEIRQDFPILQTQVRGKPLVYFDNAATTQKPRVCIDATTQYYAKENANVHRGVHYLSELATQKYEDTRQALANFVQAPSSDTIVFTRGTTEAINLVAYGFAQTILKPGDEIIISVMEHHSNMVPWQLACQNTGAVLKIIHLNPDTSLDLNHLQSLISTKTKLIALTYISNTLGTINPVDQIMAIAKQHHVPVLLDAAQQIAHLPLDVQALGCDFLAFSAHKMYGPTGVGVLYAKQEWLNKLPPYQGGGDMIVKVSLTGSTYQKPPHKFEAGTPNIAGFVAWAEAIKYLQGLGLERINAYENSLCHYLTEKISQFPAIKIIGTAPEKTAIVSFIHDNAHPHDIATLLDGEGVAIRAGHHCTMPLMDYLGVNATSRASLAFYNTFEEIDYFIDALKIVERLFQ